MSRPIVTPHYGAPDCEGCHYSSVVVVTEDSEASDVLKMRGAVCVINGTESHSGMNALRALVAPVSHNGRFFSKVKVSGAHKEIVTNTAPGFSGNCVQDKLYTGPVS